jgi:hypothetical protein
MTDTEDNVDVDVGKGAKQRRCTSCGLPLKGHVGPAGKNCTATGVAIDKVASADNTDLAHNSKNADMDDVVTKLGSLEAQVLKIGQCVLSLQAQLATPPLPKPQQAGTTQPPPLQITQQPPPLQPTKQPPTLQPTQQPSPLQLTQQALPSNQSLPNRRRHCQCSLHSRRRHCCLTSSRCHCSHHMCHCRCHPLLRQHLKQGRTGHKRGREFSR